MIGTDYFPGVVICKKARNFEIRVMHKSGPQTWKWPDKVDQIWYELDNIIEK